MTMDTSQDRAGSHAIVAALAEDGPPSGCIPPVQAGRRWQWLHGDGGELDLFVKEVRTARASEIDSRLALLSCGAELHRVIVRLATAGWPAAVTRQPHRAFPFHVATMQITRPTAGQESAQRRPQPFTATRPGRRSDPDQPIGADTLRFFSSAVEHAGGELCLLSAVQVYDLVAATVFGRRSGDLVAPRRRPSPAGAAPPDQHVVFAILYGRDDRPSTWLRAGEAFGAGCLAAADLEVSILPFTDAIKNAGARENVQRLLPGAGYPYLIMRIASLDTPRAA